MDHTWAGCLSCGSVNRVALNRVKDRPKCGHCKKALPFHGLVVEQNSNSLPNLILAADKPIVVDFWAPWCAPCLSFAPTFEGTAQKLGREMVFVKANTEADPQVGALYGVRSIPTLVLFSSGKEVQRISGALPAAQLTAWLSQSHSTTPRPYS